jgi:hypothetical protein
MKPWMGSPRNSGQPGFRRQSLLALLLIVFAPTLVRSVYADGGSVLFQRTSESISVTVFASETPVSVGVADLSVLIETPGNSSPILDAQVFIELEHQAGTKITAEATHAQARNKLLYCSLLNIPEAGKWKIKVTVNRNGQTMVVSGDLMVVQPQTQLATYGKLIAFPPVIMVLFIMNRWLRRNRRSI